jgi:hypothetical protein
MRDLLTMLFGIRQGGAVFSRMGGGRGAAWLLVAGFGVLGTVAVLNGRHSDRPDQPDQAVVQAQPGPGAKVVPLPGSIPLAALPAPLPDESATGGSPTGELTMAGPVPGWAPARAPATVPPGPSGIPGLPFAAYQHAAQALAVTAPGCHLGWPVLAAIGRAETGHAQGGQLDGHGETIGRLVGPRLDGSTGLPKVPDTDGGRWDGDPTYDRAVGPMQIVPSIWQRYGADGDGDGQVDPNDMFDSALTAARYLCAGGADLSNDVQLRGALYRYNGSDRFVTTVRSWADGYQRRQPSVPVIPPPPVIAPPVVSRSAGNPAVRPDSPAADRHTQPRHPSAARHPSATAHRPTPADRAAPRSSGTHAGPTTGDLSETAVGDTAAGSSQSSSQSSGAGQPNVVVPPAPGSRVVAGAPSERVSAGAPDPSGLSPLYPAPSASTGSSGSSSSGAALTPVPRPSTSAGAGRTESSVQARPIPATLLPAAGTDQSGGTATPPG